MTLHPLDVTASGATLVEAEVGYEIDERYGDIELQADDLALLVAIYSEFYRSSCDHLAGDEVLNFYRAEFRRRFDADEIAGLIAFYRSPLGAKLNAEWLEINRVYGKMLQDRQAEESFAAQRRYERRMDEFWLRYEEKTESAPERGAAVPGAATTPHLACLAVDGIGACHDPA